MNKTAIALHGGAGTILKKDLSQELEAEYRAGLEEALKTGCAILDRGGSALDTVEAALVKLEDNPLFNAGKGSVFNHLGKHEMDASIMCGESLLAGAVTCVQGVKNPIKLARAVMERSPHVMLCAAGAEEFARELKMEFESDEYFYTDQRHDQWVRIRDTEKTSLDHTENTKFGTAGIVALDKQGNLAAATSTGGMTNKKYSRIGDTPIIGAGTYANNLACAISCTGHGEFFIRSVVAHDVFCLMAYRGLSLEEACNEVVQQKLVSLGGEGGLIAVDNKGNICLSFNSEGMYRAYRKEGEPIQISIFR